MHNNVVGSIQGLAVPALGKDLDLAVMLEAHDAARVVFATDEPAFEVERAAVGVIRGLAKDADVAIFVQPAELPIVGNITPDQVTSGGIPGAALGPGGAGPEPLDTGVNQFISVKPLVQDDDSAVRVPLQVSAWRFLVRFRGKRSKSGACGGGTDSQK